MSATTFSTRRRNTILTIVLAAACNPGSDVLYGPEEDDAAMAVILSTWEAGGGVATLSLCEDVAKAEEWSGPTCGVDHAVRAGGLGVEHGVRHEAGCGMGGCQFEAVAFVVGTLQTEGLTGNVPVRGRVTLDAENSGSPYAFPYRLVLSCEDPTQACSVQGVLAADGSLELTVSRGDAPPGSGSPYQLVRTGPSTCDPSAAADALPAPGRAG